MKFESEDIYQDLIDKLQSTSVEEDADEAADILEELLPDSDFLSTYYEDDMDTLNQVAYYSVWVSELLGVNAEALTNIINARFNL